MQPSKTNSSNESSNSIMTPQIHLYQPSVQSIATQVNGKTNHNIHHQLATEKNIKEKQVAYTNNPLPVFLPKYHDFICIHMYNYGFIGGHYSDVSLQVNHTNFNQLYHLHAINIARSPIIRDALINFPSKEMTLNLDDENITQEGLGICFAHMYASCFHWINPNNVKSVFVAAYHLELADICAWAVEIMKKDVSTTTVIPYIKFFDQHYKEYSKRIEDFCYAFLIRKLPRLLKSFNTNPNNGNHLHEGQNICKLKAGSGFCHNRGYHGLLNIYTQLPFAWMKRILESKYLEVSSNIRYKFAKDLIAKRHELNLSNNPECVYMSFGTTHHQNITIAEKPRDLQKDFRRVLFKVPNRK
ncbi:12463_t:CDS:1 [Ambispora gerdemannii]|uniref:12463_t:CDS:1 n=1 Tax=Ambispora gerdemannii TaxID=144530 RepID=A0A9N8VY83_9GLOM|nr:12463_t:CDS:1 [Ambispora gerdemannii]